MLISGVIKAQSKAQKMGVNLQYLASALRGLNTIVNSSKPVIGTPLPNIVNASLVCGYIPQTLKLAVIKSLIKKPNLDVNVLSNYRPISNLPFLSKILEKVNGLHLYSTFIQSAVQFMPLIHPHIHTFTHQRRLAAMQGTNQLVWSNWGLGILLRDTWTRPGWDRTGNPPTARRQLLPPEPYRPW